MAQGSKDYLSRIGGTSNNIVSWYNNKGHHAIPSYVNALHNAMFRSLALNSARCNGGDMDNDTIVGKCDPRNYGISTFAEPFEITAGELLVQNTIELIGTYGSALILMISFCFVPTSFISYLIGERQREEKQVCYK